MAGFRIETGICNTDPGFPFLFLRVWTENNERILHNKYISSVAHKFWLHFILNGSISHKSQCIHSVAPQLETTLTSQPS